MRSDKSAQASIGLQSLGQFEKAPDCVRPKTTLPRELMQQRVQLVSDFFWRSCYDWMLCSQNDAFVQIVRIDLQVLCTCKTICFTRIFPCSCKNNSLLILLEWSSLPNKNWGLKVKWKLFLFIFPVNFPVNREFCGSMELSTLSTAPFPSSKVRGPRSKWLFSNDNVLEQEFDFQWCG